MILNSYQAPTADKLENQWRTLPRWVGICRDYTAADVVRLRGSVHIESTLARLGGHRDSSGDRRPQGAQGGRPFATEQDTRHDPQRGGGTQKSHARI